MCSASRDHYLSHKVSFVSLNVLIIKFKRFGKTDLSLWQPHVITACNALYAVAGIDFVNCASTKPGI